MKPLRCTHIAMLVAFTASVSLAAQTPSTAVPLVTGLAVVGSVREPAGDYESIRRVTGIASDRVAFTISGEVPGKDGEAPSQVTASRTVLVVDLKIGAHAQAANFLGLECG